MHATASVLNALLESDLNASGWDGSTTADLGRPPLQYSMTSLRNSLTKKLVGKNVDETLKSLTLQLFLSCNDACKKYVPPNLRYSEDHLGNRTWEVQDWEVLLYGEVKDLLHSFFNRPEYTCERVHLPFRQRMPDSSEAQAPVIRVSEAYEGQSFPILTWSKIFPGLDVGPGASVGAKDTDFFTKLVESPLTYTNDSMYGLYRHACSYDPTWLANENERQSRYGTEKVEGSRLSFVPKSTKIARTICTEPILNMLFQKGIASVLKARLREFFGISLSTQPGINAHLAQLGSLTGGFATIDLKSASDTISLSLVRDLIDPENFRWLEMSRSPSTTLPSGEVVQLHMIASMGNDFTFPLQTIIFSAIVHTVYRLHGITPVGPRGQSPGNFGVFGDDIVVDSRVYESVLQALRLFGFTVNVDKSFATGDFRESCGHDYYQGHEVRGVYLSGLDSELDYLSAFNRLMRWSVKHEVPLPRLLRTLRKGFRFLPVPPDCADTEGVKVPSALAPVFSRGKLAKQFSKMRSIGIWMYRYHKVVPRQRDLTPLGRAGINPHGLMLTLKAGRLQGGRIGLRSADTRTVTKVGVTPRWGYSHDWRLTALEEERWQAFLLEVL